MATDAEKSSLVAVGGSITRVLAYVVPPNQVKAGMEANFVGAYLMWNHQINPTGSNVTTNASGELNSLLAKGWVQQSMFYLFNGKPGDSPNNATCDFIVSSKYL